MNTEVMTFRDKVGIVVMTLGAAAIFFGILIFVSWSFVPKVSNPQINIVKLLVILVFGGIVLIRLSLLTVKKKL